MKKILSILAVMLLISAPVLAQEIDYCEGNFDYDQDVDGADAAVFKEDFGRSPFNEPCPSQIPLRSLVPKTGQATSYSIGDDGDLEKGVSWTNPRFTDNLDGTINDNLTGLIWLKDANCIFTNYPEFDNDENAGDGWIYWQHALDFVAGMNDGTYPDCGVNYTDWRLPNIKELFSLVHNGYYGPAVPDIVGTGQCSEGNPFYNVLIGNQIWSSTTFPLDINQAFYADMFAGMVFSHSKSFRFSVVWPVRGGH